MLCCGLQLQRRSLIQGRSGSVSLCSVSHTQGQINTTHTCIHTALHTHNKSGIFCIGLVSIFPVLGVGEDHAFKWKHAYFLGEVFGAQRFYFILLGSCFLLLQKGAGERTMGIKEGMLSGLGKELDKQALCCLKFELHCSIGKLQ